MPFLIIVTIWSGRTLWVGNGIFLRPILHFRDGSRNFAKGEAYSLLSFLPFPLPPLLLASFFPYFPLGGAQPRLKSWGGKVWVPTPGRLRPASAPVSPRAWPVCWVRCRLPPPTVKVWGYHPWEIFENSDAKSCILVTTCCKISCFLKTTPESYTRICWCVLMRYNVHVLWCGQGGLTIRGPHTNARRGTLHPLPSPSSPLRSRSIKSS